VPHTRTAMLHFQIVRGTMKSAPSGKRSIASKAAEQTMLSRWREA
jgi:hypothetical protein